MSLSTSRHGQVNPVLPQVIRECLNASGTGHSSGSRPLPGKGWRGRVGVEGPLPPAGRWKSVQLAQV